MRRDRLNMVDLLGRSEKKFATCAPPAVPLRAIFFKPSFEKELLGSPFSSYTVNRGA